MPRPAVAAQPQQRSQHRARCLDRRTPPCAVRDRDEAQELVAVLAPRRARGARRALLRNERPAAHRFWRAGSERATLGEGRRPLRARLRPCVDGSSLWQRAQSSSRLWGSLLPAGVERDAVVPAVGVVSRGGRRLGRVRGTRARISPRVQPSPTLRRACQSSPSAQPHGARSGTFGY
jgi:hypothetical protein